MSTQPNTCPCPQGYTLNSTGDGCVQTTTSTPTLSSTIYNVVAAPQNDNFGSQGVNFYEDITLKPYPIIFNPSPLQLRDANNIPLNVDNTITSPLWGYYPYVGPPYYGRLNDCGVWTDATPDSYGGVPPFNEWIGFTACVNVPVTGTYCIGIAADNMCRFKINGQLILDISYVSSSYTWTFNKWHVLPITLQSGVNIINMEGLNTASIAAFGAEIYQATPVQLAAITTASALSAVTIFTTKDKIGQSFQSGQDSGYICSGNNCTLSLCNGIPLCVCLNTIPIPACCFKLTNCVTGEVIVVTNNLTNEVGEVVNILEFPGCWKIANSNTCVGSVPVTITQSYDGGCAACVPCYLLTNCADPSQTINTYSDLSTYIGQVIQISGYPTTCWTVTSSSNCKEATQVQVVKTYGVGNCVICLCQYYELTDCAGVLPSITTTTNLLAFVGKVIKIKTCPDVCWMVSCKNDDIGATDVIQTLSFDTCDLCNPLIIPPAPELLRQRRVRPGYNTPGCSPEYTEKINCLFADQIYTQVKQRRYGISPCCEEDLQRYSIKKALLDLRAIYDPTLCVTCPPVSCCTPCPIIVPVIPVPTSCPLATNVSVTITLETPCDDVTGTVSAQIIFNNG